MFPDTVPKQVIVVGKGGLVRDLNPGPLAPKARIIPLDQRAGTSDPHQNVCGMLGKNCIAPGWARTTNLSVNSRTR